MAIVFKNFHVQDVFRNYVLFELVENEYTFITRGKIISFLEMQGLSSRFINGLKFKCVGERRQVDNTYSCRASNTDITVIEIIATDRNCEDYTKLCALFNIYGFSQSELDEINIHWDINEDKYIYENIETIDHQVRKRINEEEYKRRGNTFGFEEDYDSKEFDNILENMNYDNPYSSQNMNIYENEDPLDDNLHYYGQNNGYKTLGHNSYNHLRRNISPDYYENYNQYDHYNNGTYDRPNYGAYNHMTNTHERPGYSPQNYLNHESSSIGYRGSLLKRNEDDIYKSEPEDEEINKPIPEDEIEFNDSIIEESNNKTLELFKNDDFKTLMKIYIENPDVFKVFSGYITNGDVDIKMDNGTTDEKDYTNDVEFLKSSGLDNVSDQNILNALKKFKGHYNMAIRYLLCQQSLLS